MFRLRPVRPADSRALLVSVMRKLDQITLDAFTPAWTRPTTGH
jgi:hypothetical protein